jgi:hypothetical protein
MLYRYGGVLLLCASLAACKVSFFIATPGAVVVGGHPDLVLRPITPFPQTVPFPTCPNVQPVTARFEIVLSNGRVDHDIDHIDASFRDRRGEAGSSLSMTSREIAERFGSTLVQSGGSRTIVIVMGVGCGTGTAGTILVHVRVHDGAGTSHTLTDQIAMP